MVSDNELHYHRTAAEEKKKKKIMLMLRQPFHLLTLTLLSLLLPLSFLLLARLSLANYLLSFAPAADFSVSQPPPFSFLFSVFVYANPTLLHALVSFISLATLVHGLTGRTAFTTQGKLAPSSSRPPHLYAAWILLCALQVCVGLGIEVSIAAGIESANLGGGGGRSLLCRLVLFLGLHETTLHWCRAVVRPVVDDTVFGGGREERWGERAAMAASLGGLWWWRLRDEVDSLVSVAEMKRELLMGDFVGWWLYYLTVTIGMVRVVKGLMWVGMLLLRRRGAEPDAHSNADSSPSGDEEKV